MRRLAGYFAREFDLAPPANVSPRWSIPGLQASMSWAARAKSGQVLSVLHFGPDVFPHVSLFQFLEVFDCKGLMSHVPRSAAFGLDQTCFKMFRNSSFLDLRLQGVDVTCAALSCLRFGPDVLRSRRE